MKTFRSHLNKQLENNDFKDLFDEEKKLLEFSIVIHEEREKIGLTQSEVAKKAHITQQQLSKFENGENCNLITFLKICKALGLEINFGKISSHQYV